MFTKQSLRVVCKRKRPRPRNVDKLIKINFVAQNNLLVVNNTYFYVSDAYLDERKLEMRCFLSKGLQFLCCLSIILKIIDFNMSRNVFKFLLSFLSRELC